MVEVTVPVMEPVAGVQLTVKLACATVAAPTTTSIAGGGVHPLGRFVTRTEAGPMGIFERV
jgi:hypothetical protein